VTTYDDDFVRLHFEAVGPVNVPLRAIGLEWPPPERIVLDGDRCREATAEDDLGIVLVRERFSEITDEQRAGMTHVARGAEYRYETGPS
jgi:hypothetical protein